MWLYLFHLSLGFIVSFIGSIPPASINLITVRIAATKGFREAMWFASGAVVIEFFYSYIAIFFSELLLQNKPLTQFIQIVAIPVFVLLAFLTIRNHTPSENQLNDEELDAANKKGNSFLKGLLMGIVNVLQIPFWMIYGTYFISIGWLAESFDLVTVFVVGICMGTFSLLCIFAYFSKKIFKGKSFNRQLFNKILAGIFLLLAFIQSIKIIFWGF
jgi:threonine/homoserine/homoserine lactone efflux protein